jgi:hypothetical protein
MARKTLQFVVPLIAAAGLLTAAEFWETKPASEWSEKNVKRLLTKSPRPKEVSARLAGRMGQRPKGRMGRGGGRFEPPRITVRWLSAGPMQQAALKADGMKEIGNWSKEFYVLSVSGMRGMGGPGAGGASGSEGQQRRLPRGEGQERGQAGQVQPNRTCNHFPLPARQ